MMSYDNFMTCLTTCLMTVFVNRAPDD